MTDAEIVKAISDLLKQRPLHSKTYSDVDRAIAEAEGWVPTLLGMGAFEDRVRELLSKRT